MTEFVHLVGAGAVKSAAYEMSAAAERMAQAVSWFGEHVARMEATTREAVEALDRMREAWAARAAEGEVSRGE